MRMLDLIVKKRDQQALTAEEIQFMISGFTNGEIPDYQMSAMLMAIYFNGMNAEELQELTLAMVESGDQVDLSAIEGIKVDKHSTGGVGDTTTLVLAPLVASVGVPVAKMSGRGLGHTGGTIDKLESIEGFHVEITEEQFVDMVNKNKIAVVGQSGNLTPADKAIYALRDVTGTVQSIPLIASSIMSKKIASGSDAIVLDVKVGTGAFMKDIQQAEDLARTMVNIGNSMGRQTMAVISDMNQPLGKAIGNALEVKEAIETLKGNGPEDLTELCLTLGSQMVYLGKKAQSLEEAREKLIQSLESGAALEKMKVFVEAQGGNSEVIDHPELLPQAKYKTVVRAESDGYIESMHAEEIGIAAMMLGAGRETKESTLDLAVGLELEAKLGDLVKKGDPLVTVYSNQEDIQEVVEKLQKNIKVGNQPQKISLIHEIIQ